MSTQATCNIEPPIRAIIATKERIFIFISAMNEQLAFPPRVAFNVSKAHTVFSPIDFFVAAAFSA
jgi:hypothetical protein